MVGILKLGLDLGRHQAGGWGGGPKDRVHGTFNQLEGWGWWAAGSEGSVDAALAWARAWG